MQPIHTMIKKYIPLIGLLLWVQVAVAQLSPVIFLDIPGVPGEYTLPARSLPAGSAAAPSSNKILLNMYTIEWKAETSWTKAGGTSVGTPNPYGIMEIRFRINQSVIELYKRLINNTETAYMDIYIDKPAANPNLQAEMKRIRMHNVIVSKLEQDMSTADLPQYEMTIKFAKVSMIEHIYNPGPNTFTKGAPYGYNFSSRFYAPIYSF